MIDLLVRLISLIGNLLILLIVLDVALSWFLSPYHPVRQALDRIVDPLLAPIRRSVPLIGMFDISPIILILLISVLQSALINLLFALR